MSIRWMNPSRSAYSAPTRTAGPVLTSSGQLLFVRKRTLFAQDLDPTSLELKGTALPLAEPVIADGTAAAFSASSAGPIVYRMGSEDAGNQLDLVRSIRQGDGARREPRQRQSVDVVTLTRWTPCRDR